MLTSRESPRQQILREQNSNHGYAEAYETASLSLDRLISGQTKRCGPIQVAGEVGCGETVLL